MAVNTAETLNQQLTSRKKARAALQGLERAGHRLSRQMRNEIRAYAHEHLGWQGYADWLAVYTALAGHFRPGWLPVNYYQAEVMPRINSTYHQIGQRRAMNGYLYEQHEFPDLAYVVNGIVHDREYRVIPPDQVTEYLTDRADEVVVKADHTDSGLGVRMMAANAVTHDLLIACGNGVVQARILPHEFFHPFSQSALPTLRLATVITNAGKAEVRASYLKFGRAGHDSIMADDKLRIAVDPATGLMDERGFMSCWTPVREHPDNGVTFAGQELPMFRECVEAVLRMHQHWSLPRFVSWDVLPENVISIVPPAQDLSHFGPPGTHCGVPNVVFIGNDFERKGGPRLVAWVEGPLAGSCHLHIVSSDARGVENSAHVTVHGRVPHRGLMTEILPQMDIMCLPTDLDMSPYVLIEAAAAGVPTVATRTGGIPDLVLDGHTGLLVAPRDDAGFIAALRRMIASTESRRDMGQAAQAHAQKHFDATIVLNQMIDEVAAIAERYRLA